jgi:hypothetical protein
LIKQLMYLKMPVHVPAAGLPQGLLCITLHYIQFIIGYLGYHLVTKLLVIGYLKPFR